MAKDTFEPVSIEANLDIREPIIVSVSDFRGPRLDVRHYYENSEGELAPTKKGINVPLDDVRRLLDAVITAYNTASGQQLSLVDGTE